MWDAATITQEESDTRNSYIAKFLMTKTKAELYEEATKRGSSWAPCATFEDVPPECPTGGPGLLGDSGAPGAGRDHQVPRSTPQGKEMPWRIQRRAPLVGEHNGEVYEEELGLGKDELAVLKANGVI